MPDEARDMTVEQAVALGAQIAVQEHFGLPKAATRGYTAEQLSEEVGKLQAFGAWEAIKSEKFWQANSRHGFDVAIAPHVRGNLGIPESVHAGSPASKIIEDAGEIQNFGLDISNGAHWNLYDQYQSGQRTAQELIDVANGYQGNHSLDVNRGTGATPGQTNEQAGPRGTIGTHPGSSSGELPAAGGQGLPGLDRGNASSDSSRQAAADKNNPADRRAPESPGSNGRNSQPAGSGAAGNANQPANDNQAGSTATTPGGSSSAGTAPGSSSTGGETGSNGGSPGASPGLPGSSADETSTEDDGLSAEAVLGAGTYAIVEQNSDGSYTATFVESDGNGNQTVVGTETYTDTDGDGVYTGDGGGNLESEPEEGIYVVEETEDGATFTYSETDSSSGSDSSENSTAGNDSDDSTSTDDVDTSDVDEYTPGRDGEYIMPLEKRLLYYQTLMKSLGDTKWTPGRGGSDSTPNPMNDGSGGGASWWNPRDTVVRPVDGSSLSTGNVPNEALQQLQNPNAVQGGVIDPAKNKDQR